MKILVTGGAGFIGSHLVDRLLERGDEVLTIDNLATGRADNLEPHETLTVVEGTIVDETLVDSLLGDFRPVVVAHTAASYRDPDDWAEDGATNVVGTANVVRAAREHGVGRLIYFQTALCYGLRPLEHPISVDHPLRPDESSYAISKTAGESYVRLSGLDWISLRLANAYGPRNLSGPLPTFYRRLKAGQPCVVFDTRRDFVYIDDVVDLVVEAVDGKGSSGVYHVSSGSDVSIEELFDATVHAMGIALDAKVEVRPRSPDDAATILLDPSRTESAFGWRAATPLAAGVASTVDWCDRHGIDETYTHLKPTLGPQPRQ